MMVRTGPSSSAEEEVDLLARSFRTGVALGVQARDRGDSRWARSASFQDLGQVQGGSGQQQPQPFPIRPLTGPAPRGSARGEGGPSGTSLGGYGRFSRGVPERTTGPPASFSPPLLPEPRIGVAPTRSHHGLRLTELWQPELGAEATSREEIPRVWEATVRVHPPPPWQPPTAPAAQEVPIPIWHPGRGPVPVAPLGWVGPRQTQWPPPPNTQGKRWFALLRPQSAAVGVYTLPAAERILGFFGGWESLLRNPSPFPAGTILQFAGLEPAVRRVVESSHFDGEVRIRFL